MDTITSSLEVAEQEYERWLGAMDLRIKPERMNEETLESYMESNVLERDETGDIYSQMPQRSNATERGSELTLTPEKKPEARATMMAIPEELLQAQNFEVRRERFNSCH